MPHAKTTLHLLISQRANHICITHPPAPRFDRAVSRNAFQRFEHPHVYGTLMPTRSHVYLLNDLHKTHVLSLEDKLRLHFQDRFE